MSFLVIILGCSLMGCDLQSNANMDLQWSKLPDLPAESGRAIQPGVAGPLVGVDNDALIIAGGANFPDSPPWKKGTKVYHDDLFVLTRNSDGSLKWLKRFKLPNPLAYGVAISTDKGVICIGGHDGNTPRSDVFIISWDPVKKDVDFKTLPSLPKPVSNMGGAIIGDTIYIAGGIVDGVASNQLLAMDISDDVSQQAWKTLTDFPGPPRKQLVVAAQQTTNGKQLFIFSGLSYRSEDKEPFVSTDGFRYNPKTDKWSAVSPIKPKGFDPVAVCGGSAIEYGENQILVFGGRGSQNLAWILKIIRARLKAKDIGDNDEYDRLDEIVYGYFTKTEFHFNNRVLLYNTLTDKWTSPGKHNYIPVTNTNAVFWNGKIVLASGERQPGIRTPEIFALTIKDDK